MTKERKEQVQYLLTQFVEGRSSEKEEALLYKWLDENKEDDEWESIVEELMLAEEEFIGYNKNEWKGVVEGILKGKFDNEGEKVEGSRLREATAAEGRQEIEENVEYNPDEASLSGSFGEDSPDEAAPIRMLRRWLAAAVLIGLLGLGIWFVINRDSDDSLRQAQTDINDVKAPEINRAMITLANGERIFLDSTGVGNLVTIGDVRVVKHSDGRISYEIINSNQQAGEVVYNVLTNPRGSKVIDMTLADGSRVWLNAGSSIRYPVAFRGNERRVSIEGEAYFEVAKAHPLAPSRREGGQLRENIPFHVESGGVVTEVLGTHFNVNAYGDESVLKVTLLEGSVAVKTDKERMLLEPGESAFVKTTADKAIQLQSNVDVEEVMAWKEGRFVSSNVSLDVIMREMARWYDVEVVYEDKISDKYTVNVSRDVPVSKLFQFIEMSGGVRFQIVGKKVIVKKSE